MYWRNYLFIGPILVPSLEKIDLLSRVYGSNFNAPLQYAKEYVSKYKHKSMTKWMLELMVGSLGLRSM